MHTYYDPADLANSPLLVQAITAHGGQRTPSLHGRTHPAYRNLEVWAREAAPPASTPPAARHVLPTTKPPAANDPFDPDPFNKALPKKK